MDSCAGPIPTTGTLAAWEGWWIETRCRCRMVWHPFRLLAAEHGGERPASMVMIDVLANPDGALGPYPPSRRVPVPEE